MERTTDNAQLDDLVAVLGVECRQEALSSAVLRAVIFIREYQIGEINRFEIFLILVDANVDLKDV